MQGSQAASSFLETTLASLSRGATSPQDEKLARSVSLKGCTGSLGRRQQQCVPSAGQASDFAFVGKAEGSGGRVCLDEWDFFQEPDPLLGDADTTYEVPMLF